MERSARPDGTGLPARGGSDPDSPYIVEIIAKTSMCLECVASKTGTSRTRAADAIERIRTFMIVAVEPARCTGCLRVTTTYRIAGALASASAVAPPARPPALTQNAALWQFLESHRRQMFCTQCIANALFATKRIDRAVIGAEGRGARRQYGACASCGKERLLCGLVD